MLDSNLPIFISVAESGSFSQAGLHLGKSPQAVFKQITTFEERLGVKLFDRSPASIKTLSTFYLFLKSPLKEQKKLKKTKEILSELLYLL